MADSTELRRMPPGESCSICGSRKWYLLDGMRYCARDHQIEGYIQLEISHDEEAGVLGAVSRREKEQKQVDEPRLKGKAARSLYLEALQLTLRNQLLWLINSKEIKSELETVVRDLWDLRIRGFDLLSNDEEEGREEEGVAAGSETPNRPPSGSEELGKVSRAEIWDSGTTGNFPLPRMLDMLSLCYLGCLLLRIPTRIQTLCHWANESGLPYRRAYYDLPGSLQKRMSPKHTASLKQPLNHRVRGGELHRAVMNLVVSYQLNYKMTFPEINYIPMAVQLAQNLALPIESVIVTNALSTLLGCNFNYPVKSAKIVALNYPEIHLAALLVVATKLCFPLNSSPSLLNSQETTLILPLDWETWTARMEELLDGQCPPEKLGDISKLTVDDIVALSDEDLNDFFSHVASSIHDTDEMHVSKFFPSERPPSPGAQMPVSELGLEKAKAVLHQALEAGWHRDSGKGHGQIEPRARYEAVRDTRGLTGSSSTLYRAVCEVAGIPIETLTLAVYAMEQRIVSWQNQARRAAQNMDVDR